MFTMIYFWVAQSFEKLHEAKSLQRKTYEGNFHGETDPAIDSDRLWKVAGSWNSRGRGGNARISRTVANRERKNAA